MEKERRVTEPESQWCAAVSTQRPPSNTPVPRQPSVFFLSRHLHFAASFVCLICCGIRVRLSPLRSGSHLATPFRSFRWLLAV
jgi:hypothetical protein